MSRLKLTYRQRRRLRRQLKAATDARLYRRTLAVLELDRGRSAADIADMLGVTRQTVHNWATAYTQPEAHQDHEDRQTVEPPSTIRRRTFDGVRGLRPGTGCRRAILAAPV